MKKILFFLIIAGTHAFGHGGMIKGKVMDAGTGSILSESTVYLNDNLFITFTDPLGNFKFDNLPPGSYELRATFIGYQPETISLTIYGEETQTVIIKLTPTSLRLDEITVTGHKTAEQSITTISKVNLELNPVKSSQDILRMIPGLVTAQHAGGGKAEQIFLRGFDIDHGTDITLQVDGLPVNMVSHAHGQGYSDLHFLTPEIIDYVDFNKGPYYSKMGDFNTAGYANFQTKNALEESSVKMEVGRFDTYRTVALLNLLNNTAKNQNAYLAAEYHFTNGPFISPQNFNRINLFGKFHGLISEHKILSVSLSTFKSEWDASGQIPERAISTGMIGRFGAIDDTEGGITGRSNLNMAVTHVYDDGASFKNQVYYSNYNFELYSNFTLFLNDPINGDEIKQKENRNIYGYQGTYLKEIYIGQKSIRTEAGIGFRYDDITNNELSHVRARYTFLQPISLSDVDQINGNLYADATINLSSHLILNAGLRLDAFSFQYADKLSTEYNRESETAITVSPKLNLYYNVTPDFQLYLKSGMGFHSNDARVVIAQQGYEILPRAYGVDVGTFVKPFKNFLMNIAIWQLKLDQEFVYVGDEGVVEPSGETQRYGVDFSIRYQMLDWLYLTMDANYAKGKSIHDPEGENYIPLAPIATSIAGITGRWKNGLAASVHYRFISDRPANEDNSVQAQGYFLLDANITYQVKQVDFSLNITNLLNRDWNEAQFDTETRLPGEATGVSELTFTPGDPIFFKAGVRVRF